MNPLQSRKRLLVAESELNRALLVQEGVAMTVGVRTLTDRVKSFMAITSAAGLLVTFLTVSRRGKVGRADGKPSWLQMIRKGASLVSALWPALRVKSPEHENNQPTSRI